jgi:MFS family permease
VITFFFGVGQVAGPAVAGILADRTGSFSSSFAMAAVLAVAAIAVSALLRPPHRAAAPAVEEAGQGARRPSTG